MSIDLFFYQNPVFTHEEFAQWKNQNHQGQLKPISINTAIQHYIHKGKIVRVRRGLYAVVPPGQRDTFVDSLLIAGCAASDSTIAYHSAMEWHGVAYSIYSQTTYLTNTKAKPFEFQNQWYSPTQYPKILAQQNKTNVYTETINRQGKSIRVTNLARTYVDMIDRIDLCGGWEEVCRAIEMIAVVDINTIIDYCLLLKNAILAAKVGYFLDLREGAFKVADAQLAKLHAALPKRPEYVSRDKTVKYQFINKWNLLLPIQVINQTWEEPYADI